MKKREKYIFLILFLTILFISIWPFFFYFKQQPFSKNLKDWADAATWFSLFISLITTGFLGYLTWHIHKNEIQNQNKQISLLRGIEKPVLTFYCEKDSRPVNIDKWFVKNIGKGPALNISICHYTIETQKWNNELVDCYSMGTDETAIELKWLMNIKCAAILAFYQDTISNEFYCSLAMNDQTHVINLQEEFKFHYNNQEILNEDIVVGILSQNHIRKNQAIENNRQPPSYSFV